MDDGVSVWPNIRMGSWLLTTPHGVNDGGGMLLFALVLMLQKRAAARATWRLAQSADYERVRAARLQGNASMAVLDEYGPNVWQQAWERSQQRGDSFDGLFGADVGEDSASSSFSQASSQSDPSLSLLRVATWAYMFLTREDMFPIEWTGPLPRSRSAGDWARNSAALQLRATCRSWAGRLRFFRCCECGVAGPPKLFHGWHTYTRWSGMYGQCECRSCDSLLESHLSCAECGQQAQRSLADHLSDSE